MSTAVQRTADGALFAALQVAAENVTALEQEFGAEIHYNAGAVYAAQIGTGYAYAGWYWLKASAGTFTALPATAFDASYAPYVPPAPLPDPPPPPAPAPSPEPPPAPPPAPIATEPKTITIPWPTYVIQEGQWRLGTLELTFRIRFPAPAA